MSTIERITITLTAEMAHSVRAAVQAGEYASSSEIIREALPDWRLSKTMGTNSGLSNAHFTEIDLISVRELWCKIHHPATAR